MSSPATTKRSHAQLQADGEQVVDDLMFASTFAAVMPPGMASSSTMDAVPVPSKQTEDDNEIPVDEEDEESETDDDGDGDGDVSKSDEENSDSDGHDDDDDDEDLKAALERMEAVNEEEDPVVAASSAPKTENEVDGYKVPIQELESKLQLKLSVGDGGTAATVTTKLDPKQVSTAGKIINFMVEDRTVVVESAIQSPSTNWQQQSGGPLDEGTLLVLQVPATLVNEEANSDSANATEYVPLGRIFEVFGPVSRPLYTIRLPSSKSSTTKSPVKTAKAASKTNKQHSSAVPEDSNGRAQEAGDDQKADNSAESQTVPPTDTSQKPEPDSAHSTETTTRTQVSKPKDPWAADGALTKYLLQNTNVQVLYVQDEAKLIDTGLVLRSSGKGCDASNLYDEEVMNSNEMYYSDDEKEREAKNRRKGSRRKGRGTGKPNSRNHQSQQPYNGNQGYGAVPQGFHSMPQQHSQPSFHPQQAGVPHGYHQQMQPPIMSQYGQPPPPQPYFAQQQLYVGAGMVPPPPPPPPPPQAGSYAAGVNSAPPPPPPRNPHEPPAYQY